MQLLAHRGASAEAPENTLEAFAEAVRQQADGVELDAMVCGSGEVVVCHDETLERLAGVEVAVGTTPYPQLRELDVGTPLGFGRARIPLLEEVLDLLPAWMVVNIELKCDTVEDRGLSWKVARLVERRKLEERVILSSFNPLCLFRVAAVAPPLRRGLLIDPDKRFLWQNAVTRPLTANFSVHPHHSQVTPARLREWRAAALEVAVWTVDDPQLAGSLRDAGVGYCITNRPAALRAGLG